MPISSNARPALETTKPNNLASNMARTPGPSFLIENAIKKPDTCVTG
jgi:hypothetical protein